MSHRPHWPTARQTIAFFVVLAAVGFVYAIHAQTEVIDDLRTRLAEASVKVDSVERRDAADQKVTECVRALSTDLQDKLVDNSLAFNRYVIGLGQRGDVAALTAELDAAGLALQGARDAYVAQVCPGG